MLNGILLGIVFGVILLTGIAIAYNQFHVETTPEANIFEVLTDEQRQQIQNGEKISNIELEQEQLDEITKTLEHIEVYDIELTEAEKILLEQIIETQVNEITQEDVDLLLSTEATTNQQDHEWLIHVNSCSSLSSSDCVITTSPITKNRIAISLLCKNYEFPFRFFS